MAQLNPFHLAFAVDDLGRAREFYVGVLGCGEGRSSESWIDFDLFGHQIVAHLAPPAPQIRRPVDGHGVPVPHFGLVLHMEQFDALVARLERARVKFEIEPHVRFRGQPGEQATLFILDPAGNALEFKAFRDFAQIFAKQ